VKRTKKIRESFMLNSCIVFTQKDPNNYSINTEKPINDEKEKTTMDMSGRVLRLPILDGTHAPDKLCHIGSGKGCKS
jgi:hypothetical protein